MMARFTNKAFFAWWSVDKKEYVDIDKLIDGLVHSNQESHRLEGA
jgi:hypothetical protein